MLLALVPLASLGQAKKPVLMVMPSDAWCNEHGYTQTYSNQGTDETVPDYKAAVSRDKQLNAVISKINNLMADRGFPLKDLQQTLKSINNDAAEDALITSKAGSAVAESPLDRLRRRAKPDIILEIDWTVNQVGPKSSITYNLRALDAYSDKQVAGAEGTGKGSFSAELPVLLEEAVQDNMDQFCERLQEHFDDMMQNGREVALVMKVFDNGSGLDFEQEYGDEELNEVIDNWLSDHCVNHRFNKVDATETTIQYDQVRIPLYKENGQAMDTYAFARDLARFFKAPPYNIPVKTVNKGLGKCELIFGEK